jgi:hypothetical protein
MKPPLLQRKKVFAATCLQFLSCLTAADPGTKRRKGAVDIVDDDGILEDIVLTSTSAPSATRREEKTRDINAFFNEVQPVTLRDGTTKRYRICKKCP